MSREHLTTATHPQYLPAIDQTMLTVYLEGDVKITHGDKVTVTTKEGK